MKKFAVFDIDGTLFRWQLYHELFDTLLAANLIPKLEAAKVLESRTRWQQRLDSYSTYEMSLVGLMEQAIVGLDEKQLMTFADDILATHGQRLYRYTRTLLNTLKADGYVLIAISASHQQLVERFSRLHNIDIAIGKNHVIKDGKLTGEAEIVHGQKAKILDRIVKDNDLSWEDSYAVGDSDGDITMLEKVTNPIAFNPSEQLLAVAMERDWKIVIERKNIAYTLEKRTDGSYLLAKTDCY